MHLKKLTIIGFSEPVLTMIFDNLESCQVFPDIVVVNNLQLNAQHAYQNARFNISQQQTYNQDASPYFLGVNKAENKIKVVSLFNLKNEHATCITHTSAEIASTVNMGSGCMINSHVSVAGQSSIGNFVTINRNASVGHHTVLEDFVTINPGAHVAGFVTIGKGSTIGMGANVIDGITIGKNVTIGAGSVVTKNIEDNAVAYGNPCRVVRIKN
ncbi:acetyltransferase [Bizionia sediminis]|uniref:Acetyltransferase n=1 Tax=Bizionia sediminis TaxID=1737064 RepID=A0ABW5KRD8_9FLAO